MSTDSTDSTDYFLKKEIKKEIVYRLSTNCPQITQIYKDDLDRLFSMSMNKVDFKLGE